VPDEALLRIAGHHALHNLDPRFALLVAEDDLATALLLVGGEECKAAQDGLTEIRTRNFIPAFQWEMLRTATSDDVPGTAFSTVVVIRA
jgi:hypothetical protein